MVNAYNEVKIFHHKDLLDALSQDKHIAPLYVRLKPTNLCNQHCSYCTYGSGNTHKKTNNRNNISHQDMIPWEKLQEILSDMKAMGTKALTFSGGGEPLTYPYIVDAARLATDYGIALSLITNGQLLSGERAQEFYNARWVRVSFDAPEEIVYMKLRGVTAQSYKQVIQNIGSFAKNKNPDCVLGINFVISKANYNLVYTAASLMKEIGVDNIKFSAVIENSAHYHDEIKDDVIDQIHRAESKFCDEKFSIVNNYEHEWKDKHLIMQTFPVCYTCRLVTVIGADQKIYFCHTRCYDSYAEVGDLRERSFRDVWVSEDTKNRIRGLSPQRDCKNICVYEARNKLIQAYLDVNEQHVNFI